LFIDLISIINQQYELELILNLFNKLFFCSFSFIYQSDNFILIFLEFGQSNGSCSTWFNISFSDNSISISKQAPSDGCKNCKVVADIDTQNWSNFFYWDLNGNPRCLVLDTSFHGHVDSVFLQLSFAWEIQLNVWKLTSP
jgi:hypothetical protein